MPMLAPSFRTSEFYKLHHNKKKAKIRSHPHIQRNSLSPSNIHKDTAVGTYVEICLVALSNDGLVCRFFVIIKAHKSCCIQSTQSHTFKRKHTYACASFHRPQKRKHQSTHLSYCRWKNGWKSSSDEKRCGKINTARVTSVAKAAATVEKQVVASSAVTHSTQFNK